MTKTKEAVARADALLRERLSPEQRADLARTRSFLVTTPAGRRYRLHEDRTNYQVDLLAPDSEYVLAKYCVQPRDQEIPRSDSLLAQMLLLQSDEALFLLTANVQLSVHALARYLSGEVVPRPPNTPEHEPRIAEYNDDHAFIFTGNTMRRPNRREAAIDQIRVTYRCASHPDARVEGASESADGRSFHVRYTCDCPTQYVSLRAHEERQRQLEAPENDNDLDRRLLRSLAGRVLADAANAHMDNMLESLINPPNLRSTQPPVHNADWHIAAAVAVHGEGCPCSAYLSEYSGDGREIIVRFACGAERRISQREMLG